MTESIAEVLELALAIYVGLGLLFAVPFAVRGVGRIDPRARSGSAGFRVLIVPGAAALWPLLLGRWLRASPPPMERNAHRSAALSGSASPRAHGPSPDAPGGGA